MVQEQRDPRDRPAVDPSRYLLAEDWNKRLLWLDPEPPHVGSNPPVPLDAHVAEWRAEIEAQVGVEPDISRVDAVVISQARTRALVALMRELSTRLRPGLAVPPVVSDGSLSAFALELAEDLLRRS
jgi:hypothetical protein